MKYENLENKLNIVFFGHLIYENEEASVLIFLIVIRFKLHWLFSLVWGFAGLYHLKERRLDGLKCR